jgi:glycosyltransferase involved in cell wall biosynthesis
MKGPLVSVIISAYNAEKYLAQTLNSVLAQTWPNLEVIVVNDGSTDNTLSILNKYADRINIISQENKGQDAALNKGYRNCHGHYVKFMDSDDLMNPEMIEIQVNALLDSGDDHVAYGEWARFYDDDFTAADFTSLPYWRDMSPLDFLTAMPEGVMLQCGIMLIPRTILLKAGLWDERLILFNDTEYFGRVLTSSEGVKFSAGARLYYRSGLSGSISVQRSRRFFESTLLATELLGETLLDLEDSNRVRGLLANLYFNQYFEMFPFFKDLRCEYESRMKALGVPHRKPDGGQVFKLLSFFLGWKITKRIQMMFYRFGYRPGTFYS